MKHAGNRTIVAVFSAETTSCWIFEKAVFEVNSKLDLTWLQLWWDE